MIWKNRCPDSPIVSDFNASLNRWSSELFEDYGWQPEWKMIWHYLTSLPHRFSGAQRISIFGTFPRHHVHQIWQQSKLEEVDLHLKINIYFNNSPCYTLKTDDAEREPIVYTAVSNQYGHSLTADFVDHCLISIRIYPNLFISGTVNQSTIDLVKARRSTDVD